MHPHVLRHTCAKSLLQAGVDTSVLALWLGHAGIRSTDAYLHADMSIKEKALALTTPQEATGRYHPPTRSSRFSKVCDHAEPRGAASLLRRLLRLGARHSREVGIGPGKGGRRGRKYGVLRRRTPPMADDALWQHSREGTMGFRRRSRVRRESRTSLALAVILALLLASIPALATPAAAAAPGVKVTFKIEYLRQIEDPDSGGVGDGDYFPKVRIADGPLQTGPASRTTSSNPSACPRRPTAGPSPTRTFRVTSPPWTSRSRCGTGMTASTPTRTGWTSAPTTRTWN
ncbi:tyrosine-type recombinase/integrase [Nonomuraea recticatena]|uniref:tyrosine-type recombinase/integrase n=1 Tax=Nonomuraea recticatena TaxID=46178 RepID=UPI003D153E0F